MDLALALDISTNIIGWCVLSTGAKAGSLPLNMGHIDIRKVSGGFWEKADIAKKMLYDVIDDIESNYDACITKLFIEDPVKRFRSGSSSANTIALLAKFNCLVSYFARIRLNLEPAYIGATDARKSLGIKLVSKNKAGGLSQKQQTFQQLSETVFKNTVWPVNMRGNIQPYCYDEVDAYVICMAGVCGAVSS